MQSLLRPTCTVSLSCASLQFFTVLFVEGSQVPGARAVDLELAATTEGLYTVGTFSGQDWETFGRVTDVDFDASGNLYILDEGNYRVVVLDRAGELVRMIGSQGEGPGEFSRPTSAAILGDGRLVVYDTGFPAMKVFDPAGDFVSGTIVNPLQKMPGALLLPIGTGRLVTTGGMKFRGSSRDVPEDPPVDDHLRDIDIFSLDGSGMEVLYRAWGLPREAFTAEINQTDALGRKDLTLRRSRLRAFGPPLHLGVLPDGRVAVVDSVGYRVKLIGLNGGVTGVIEREIAPEPVTEAIQEAERARMIEGLTGSTGSRIPPVFGMMLDGEAAEEYREQTRAMIEDMVFAEEIPVVAGMAVDGGGRFWIARRPRGGTGDGPIDLMTPEGDYIGTLPPDGPRIPDAFGPDGLMAYIETGELDVPGVRVIRLVSLER